MKLIKLNNRHNLGKAGYNYAFIFPTQDLNYFKVANLVKETEGYDWRSTHTFTGKTDSWGRRTRYVGFKKESTATMVQLKM